MNQKSLTEAAQAMLDAVMKLSRTPSVDWMDSAYAPVALAHSELTEALKLHALCQGGCRTQSAAAVPGLEFAAQAERG